MNLRTVLLKKTTLLCESQFSEGLQLNKMILKPWVTLGHFDAMYTYQLDTKNQNVFATIHENNSLVAAMNDENTYYHPLYLLTDLPDKDFWEQDSWFMAVTRIHLTSTVAGLDEIEGLRKYIAEQCEAAECRCSIYQTVELSDLTMVVKSDRIGNMLKIILNLWSHPGIGKLYTYCGVDYGHLENLGMWPDEHDIIDFLSMRFAVRDPDGADTFFRVIKDELGEYPTYSIAGVDDAVLNFNSLPVRKLVHFLRHWLVTGLPEDINTKQVFSDITTRLGTSYQKCDLNEGAPRVPQFQKCEYSPPNLHSLDQLCYELVELCNEVHRLAEGKLDSPSDKYWLRSFSELSYSLLRLSRAAPLDEFVYLMLPGVKSFLCNMKDILNSEEQDRLEDLDKESLCLFVDNWSHLMEHIMRLEGQLVHHPETRPILYDIPLAMLEHTLALLDLCSRILQEKDKAKKDIQFILFPKLCSIIETEEIFTANYQTPGLLSIPIPLHMMYAPQTIQITLCHEISHFVGESHRNRPLRRDCYIYAAAILIAELIFDSEDELFIEQIYQKLKEHIIASEEKLKTIYDVEVATKGWINQLLDNGPSVNYCDLIRDVLKKAIPNADCRRVEFSTDFINLQERNNYFALILPKVTTLFREVFADICMMCLLDLDADTYLEALYGGVIENPDSVEFTAVRIYTTLSAVGKHIPARVSHFEDETGERFYYSIQRLITGQANQNFIAKTYQFPISCVKKLQTYSDKCAADIKELLEEDDVKEMVGRLQKMYRNVMSSNMNYALLWEFINDYRKKCLSGNS